MQPLERARSGEFELLGEGVSRSVYAYDNDTVLKVARSERGRKKNRREREISDPGLPVAPVLGTTDDASGLLMRRATSTEASPNDAARVRSKLHYHGDWYDPDMHTGNVGRIGDAPVAIDYGSAYRRPVSEMDDLERQIHGLPPR